MNKEDKIKKNVAEMRSQWESWKSRDDMTFSRFVQLKNGPELSEEETIKNLCEARLKVRNHEDVFDSARSEFPSSSLSAVAYNQTN